MVKFPTSPYPFLIRRRAYAVASAENVIRVAVVQSPAGTVTRKAAASATTTTDKKENFWMRDPNTGNWIPETHFGENQIDAAELREKFLPKHKPT
ncbi:hypothetical protein FNV43_RR08055 [Rhamnella rubrinervis]|uniref:Late embryogenesis abundant protein n=1 Tax=Rhamnella rubrinervis TaxID=2594499 RepID=A0A8K0HGX1_9ROSA|nr:hypothetical protein FNV43_RR08055 [Rhamnella rubrinervis]